MSVAMREGCAGHRTRLLGILAISAAALGWAVVEWLGGRISDSSPYQVVWARYGTHLVVLLLIVSPRQGVKFVRTSRPFLQIFRSLLMLTMPLCFVMAAQRGMDAKVLWAFTWISVPIMMGAAVWLLGEKMSPGQGLLTLTGLLGVWLVLKPPVPPTLISGLLALGVAASFGLYAVLTRVLRTEHTGTNLFHTAVWVFLPLSLNLPRVWQTPTLAVTMTMIAIGVIGLGLLYLIDRALAYAPTTLVAPFLFLECLWSVALGYIHGPAGLGRFGLIGAALILGSCLWLLLQELRSKAGDA